MNTKQNMLPSWWGWWVLVALVGVFGSGCGGIDVKPPSLGDATQGKPESHKISVSTVSSSPAKYPSWMQTSPPALPSFPPIPASPTTQLPQPAIFPSPSVNKQAWWVTTGGDSHSSVISAKTDKHGNTYVLGHFQNVVMLGSITLSSEPGQSLFVAKVDSYGKFQWATPVSWDRDGSPRDNGRGLGGSHLAVNDVGEVVIAGMMTSNTTARLGTKTLITPNERGSVFVAKLSGQGEFQWARANETGAANLQGIGIDQEGRVTVVGHYQEALRWGHRTLPGEYHRSFRYVYVCHITQTGDVEWLLQIMDEQSSPQTHIMAIDAHGDIHLAGNIAGELRVGESKYPSPNTRLNNAYWLKISRSRGTAVAFVSFLGQSVTPLKLEVTNQGSVYLVGSFWKDLTLGQQVFHANVEPHTFVLHFHESGKILWAKTFPIPLYYSNQQKLSLVVNQQQALLSMPFAKTIVLGNGTFSPPTGKEASLLMKFDASGELMRTNVTQANLQLQCVSWDGKHIVYAANYEGIIKIGTQTLEAVNTRKWVVVTAQEDGTPVWITSSHGLPFSKYMDHVVDTQGNIYLLGNMGGNWIHSRGQEKLPEQNGLLLSRWNQQGQIQWEYLLPPGLENPKLSVDTQGNLYLAANISGNLLLGSFLLQTKDYRDVMVARFSAQGQLVWAKSISGVSAEMVNTIATDSEGNLLMLGQFYGDTYTIGTTTLRKKRSPGIFLTKWNASGDVLWARSLDVGVYDESFLLVPGKYGKFWLKGAFYQSLTVDDQIVMARFNRWGAEPFLLRMNSQGWPEWVFSKESNSCSFLQMAATANEELVLIGSCAGSVTWGHQTIPKTPKEGSLLVARLDRQGQVLWFKLLPPLNFVSNLRLALDNQQQAYLFASFTGKLTWGDHAAWSQGYSDFFLSRLDNQGNILRVWTWGGKREDTAHHLAVSNHRLLLIGSYRSSFHSHGMTLFSQSGEHLFLQQIKLPQ